MCNSQLRTKVSDHSLLGTSLANAKLQLKLTDSEDDVIVTEYIKAATDRLERWLGMSFLFSRNESFYNYCSYCKCFTIYHRPLCVIEKVEYLSSGDYVELLPADYEIFETTLNTFIQINASITVDSDVPDPIKITYILGFTDEIEVSSVTKASDELTITTSSDHGLDVGSLICLSSEIPEYTGMFPVAEKVSATEFKIIVDAGDPEPTGTFILSIESVPDLIQVGIKQMVAAMYMNAGDCSDKCGSIPCCTMALLKSYKKRIIRTTRKPCGC